MCGFPDTIVGMATPTPGAQEGGSNRPGRGPTGWRIAGFAVEAAGSWWTVTGTRATTCSLSVGRAASLRRVGNRVERRYQPTCSLTSCPTVEHVRAACCDAAPRVFHHNASISISGGAVLPNAGVCAVRTAAALRKGNHSTLSWSGWFAHREVLERAGLWPRVETAGLHQLD